MGKERVYFALQYSVDISHWKNELQNLYAVFIHGDHQTEIHGQNNPLAISWCDLKSREDNRSLALSQ